MTTSFAQSARTTASPELITYLNASNALASGLPCAVPDLLAAIEDIWLDHHGMRLHLDLYRAAAPRAVVVFLPGSGSYARFYCALGAQLAKAGYHLLGIDRPGHGYSDGIRGDCTIDQALDVTAAAVDYAREQFKLPVVLLGSSMGGLLTGFALLAGIRVDLAIAHNFLMPGRLISMRARAWYIDRYRSRPYALTELVHGFKDISTDTALRTYLAAQTDPYAAWHLSAQSVASLFRHNPPRTTRETAPLVLMSGTKDRIIPALASRLFLKWSGLRHVEYQAVENAGHMLFHDHLAQSLPVLRQLIERVAVDHKYRPGPSEPVQSL